MTDLAGRTAVVTGASRGIGAACARALDDAGARVALVARNKDDLEAVAASLGNDPVVLPSDLAEEGAADALAATLVEQLGRIDILVNNAGQSLMRPAAMADHASADALFAINQTSVLVLASKIGAHMAANGGGSIVNMSSAAAKVGVPMQAAYAATKGALDAMTRALAAELGPGGVRVNAVNPGIIETDMWDAGLKLPGVREYLERLTPLRRLGTAEDIADVVVFLASDASRYISAQTIVVDGGGTDTLVLLPPALTDR